MTAASEFMAYLRVEGLAVLAPMVLALMTLDVALRWLQRVKDVGRG